MARKRATLRDVARMAAVTPSTVSRLLNDKPLPVPVTAATRSRVLEAAKALDYRPNRLARGLASSATRVLGMTFPMTSPLKLADHREVTFLNFGMMVSGVQNVTQVRGYELHIFNRVEHHYDPDYPPRPMNLDFVDGLIYVEPNPQYPYYEEIAKTGLPVVMMGPRVPGCDTPSVGADDKAEVYRLVRALLRKGHRRIGYHLALMNEPPVDVIQRVEGYRLAHEEAGVPIDPALLRRTLLTETSLAADLSEMLASSPPITALLIGRTEVAVDALGYLGAANMRVPDDIEVVVIGDDRYFELVSPRLTAMRFDYLKVAEEAARVLVDTIEGADSHPVRLSVPWQFRERDSCVLARELSQVPG